LTSTTTLAGNEFLMGVQDGLPSRFSWQTFAGTIAVTGLLVSRLQPFLATET
jgi:hypothetical protein